MQRKSTIFSGAVSYVAEHEDMEPFLDPRDNDDSYWCHRVVAKFIKEENDRVYMNVIYDFTHLVNGVQKSEIVKASIYYNRSNGSYKLLEVKVQGGVG